MGHSPVFESGIGASGFYGAIAVGPQVPSLAALPAGPVSALLLRPLCERLCVRLLTNVGTRYERVQAKSTHVMQLFHPVVRRRES